MQHRGLMSSDKSVEDGILLVRWTDNNVITMASNVHGMQQVSKARRYSRIQRKSIDVDCPNVVEKYNKHMGGTDQMDQNVNAYRIGVRGNM